MAKSAQRAQAALSSVVLHLLGLLWLLSVPPARYVPIDQQVLAGLQKRTTLVAPPPRRVLTQRAPDRGQPSREVSVEALLARRSSPPPFPSPPVSPPKAAIPEPAPTPAPPPPSEVPAPPREQAAPPAAEPPPEVPEVQEKPKLAFEKPADSGPSRGPASGIVRSGSPAIRLPSSSLDDAIQEVARNRRGSGMMVGSDLQEDVGGILETRPAAPSQSRASTVELLSDPKGVDFRPYLIRVLNAVRRNWRAVFPESARFGSRGKVVVLFSIDRAGRIPKLVIFEASGTEALDRAAVAGISASDPLPPLPNDFSGDEVRLQLNFFYNMRQ